MAQGLQGQEELARRRCEEQEEKLHRDYGERLLASERQVSQLAARKRDLEIQLEDLQQSLADESRRAESQATSLQLSLRIESQALQIQELQGVIEEQRLTIERYQQKLELVIQENEAKWRVELQRLLDEKNYVIEELKEQLRGMASEIESYDAQAREARGALELGGEARAQLEEQLRALRRENETLRFERDQLGEQCQFEKLQATKFKQEMERNNKMKGEIIRHQELKISKLSEELQLGFEQRTLAVSRSESNLFTQPGGRAGFEFEILHHQQQAQEL